MRCEGYTEVSLPGLAAFISELWRGCVTAGRWLQMRDWLSGTRAALFFVSGCGFEDVIEELEFLETVCTWHYWRMSDTEDTAIAV